MLAYKYTSLRRHNQLNLLQDFWHQRAEGRWDIETSPHSAFRSERETFREHPTRNHDNVVHNINSSL